MVPHRLDHQFEELPDGLSAHQGSGALSRVGVPQPVRHAGSRIVFAVAIFFCGLVVGQFVSTVEDRGFQLLEWDSSSAPGLVPAPPASVRWRMSGAGSVATGDDSRNSFILSCHLGGVAQQIHHRHMGCVRQGFYWWEIDITYYLLKVRVVGRD